VSKIKDEMGNSVNSDGIPFDYICDNSGCPIRLTACPIMPKSIGKDRCFMRGHEMVKMPKCECGFYIDYSGKFCQNCGKELGKQLKLVPKTKVIVFVFKCECFSSLFLEKLFILRVLNSIYDNRSKALPQRKIRCNSEKNRKWKRKTFGCV